MDEIVLRLKPNQYQTWFDLFMLRIIHNFLKRALQNRAYYYIDDLSMIFDSDKKTHKYDQLIYCIITLINGFIERDVVVIPNEKTVITDPSYAKIQRYFTLDDFHEEDPFGKDDSGIMKKEMDFPPETYSQVLRYSKCLEKRIRYLYVWISKKGDLDIPVYDYMIKAIEPFKETILNFKGEKIGVPIWKV